MNLRQADNDLAKMRLSSCKEEETTILNDKNAWKGDNNELHSSRHSDSFSILQQEDQENEDYSFYGALEKINTKVSQFKKDNFKILNQVGQGSFCKVYKACHLPSKKTCDRTFAIKQLKKYNGADGADTDEGYVDLIKETAILSSLRHDNIINLHGSYMNRTGGSFFFVMELLVDTLDKRLIQWKKQQRSTHLFYRKKWLDDKEIIRRVENVAVGIVKGMEYLHSRNIMHRDLKPSNIGFDELDKVKIFDFGLSRVYTTKKDTKTSQADALMMSRRMTLGIGTPRYMAPEIARSEHLYDLSVDIYSFGVLLWQLLTNRLPYKNFTEIKHFLIKVAFGGKRPPLKHIREKKLRNLCNSCWSENAQERPSFSVIRRDLENVLSTSKDQDYVLKN